MPRKTTVKSSDVRTRPTYDGNQVAARFDNAAHTPDTATLYRNADALAMNAALDPLVRKTVRERARYVVGNVPYAWSMVRTYITHVVGAWASVSFPRGGIPESLRQQVVDDFDAWAMRVDLWSKVQTIFRAKVVDGEAFAMFFTDPEIVDSTNLVTLNVYPFECDRVESYRIANRDDEIDGIRFSQNHHPTFYRVLDYHPGDVRDISKIKWRAGDWKAAKFIIHYYDSIRPEQVRGVSDFVSSLDIPALQKSYRSSVVETAINAASISGILHTDQVPEYFDNGQPIGKCAADVKAGAVFQMQRGAFVTIPEGWNISQMRAEQPTTLYDSFCRSLVAEMAACLCMPVNIAMCDSSQHNFASAKLDHMTYGDHIDDVRSRLSVKVLDRIFFAWLEEYAAINRIDARTLAALRKTEWLFKERRNNDVMKDASADNTRLGNGTLSRQTYYAGKGADWKRETDQIVDEYIHILKSWKEKCKANGLDESTPCPILTRGGAATTPAPTEDMVQHEAEKSAATQGKTQKSKNANNQKEANNA